MKLFEFTLAGPGGATFSCHPLNVCGILEDSGGVATITMENGDKYLSDEPVAILKERLTETYNEYESRGQEVKLG